MSDDAQAKIRHFAIIKELHSAQTTGKRYLNYEDLENNLHLDRTSVVNSLNVLKNFAFVRTGNLAVILEPKALNVMQTYHTKDFDDFVSKYNNPPKEYGESVRIEDLEEVFGKTILLLKKLHHLEVLSQS